MTERRIEEWMPGKDRYDYFPFFVDVFLADHAVQEMDTQAVGAFLLLLLRAWREKKPGTLPTDDATLRSWARMTKKTDEEWAACWAQVRPAFKQGKGRWEQKRMMREHQKIRDNRKAKSEAGKRTAAKRWGSNSSAIAKQPHKDLNLNLNLNPNPPTPVNGGSEGGGGVVPGKKKTAQERLAEWSTQ